MDSYTERSDRVIAVMDEWFQAIESGGANLRSPDMEGKRYSVEEVDKVINIIDTFIEHELVMHPDYWSGTLDNGGAGDRLIDGIPIDTPADFNRLAGMSREAFVQAIREAKCC